MHDAILLPCCPATLVSYACETRKLHPRVRQRNLKRIMPVMGISACAYMESPPDFAVLLGEC